METNKNIYKIIFSPGKKTQEIADVFLSQFDQTSTTIDLLVDKSLEGRSFTKDDFVLVVLPVFFGRIPTLCAEMLKNFKADGTPTVIISVYGNRAFDDALIETYDIFTENGFLVLGAGAFVARHSIFPKVARNRPDNTDIALIKEFAQSCKAKLDKGEFALSAGAVIPGNRPYCSSGVVPLKPSASKRRCIKCGICAEICPTGAIPKDDPTFTDGDKCITCTACIYRCPSRARSIKGLMYMIGSSSFKRANNEYKAPVTLL